MAMILELLITLLTAALAGPQQAPAPSPVAREGAAPKGLIGIAESEAKRTERMIRDNILGLLRKFEAARETAPDRGEHYLQQIVQYGADATPLLVDMMHGVGTGNIDAVFAGPIARALAAIFEHTKNEAILKNLAEIARQGPVALRAGVLQGLETIDHPLVIDIVTPMLNEQDPALRAQVVAVLGKQKSRAEEVGNLLRPMLKQEGAPWAETLGALQDLGDKGGLDSAQDYLAKSADPTLLAASIRYLAELGGKTSLPALKGLLTHGSPNLADALLKKAVDAVQGIGLRDSDAKKAAEDILVDVFKHHPSYGVRSLACWELGPTRTSRR